MRCSYLLGGVDLYKYVSTSYLELILSFYCSFHTIVAVYTIEFQKRGLPHAHILLWLKGIKKEVTAAMIDEYISAEFPDKEVDREGFELVERHMIHGPCGRMRPKLPCKDKKLP